MSRFYNRTRTATSIPAKLMREGRIHLLPVYALMKTSHLGTEAIANSGSYEFADHIYGNRASGALLFGKLVDRLFLSLPSAQAFRRRYVCAKAELEHILAADRHGREPIEVLSVPCGLARELFEVGRALMESDRVNGAAVQMTGLDLDGTLVEHLNAARDGLAQVLEFRCGDAMSGAAYRDRAFNLIISLGFIEFLSDEQAISFFRLLRSHLKPDGILVTAAMSRHPLSDYVLRNVADLHARYRDLTELRGLAASAGFAAAHCYQPHRLLTMMSATG